MNFDVSAEVRNKSPVEEKDNSTITHHLLANHDVSHADDNGSDENLHKNSTLADSLLLPTPMNRPKSTSVVIAEKSNIWSEHKLHEKTSQLDKELYHTMMKMNASRLEVVNDLAKLKRSTSAGSLRNLHDQLHHKSQRDKPRAKTDSPIIERSANRKEAVSPSARKTLKSESDSVIIKNFERASGIEIRITSDLSSDEEEHDSIHMRVPPSSPLRRNCREERSQGEMVENVLRRYAKQTHPKAVYQSKR